MIKDRFKFRAYFIPGKYYVKITQLDFDGEGNITKMKFLKPKSIDPDGNKYVCYQDQLDKFVFEQCTGCRDCRSDLRIDNQEVELISHN